MIPHINSGTKQKLYLNLLNYYKEKNFPGYSFFFNFKTRE